MSYGLIKREGKFSNGVYGRIRYHMGNRRLRYHEGVRPRIINAVNKLVLKIQNKLEDLEELNVHIDILKIRQELDALLRDIDGVANNEQSQMKFSSWFIEKIQEHLGQPSQLNTTALLDIETKLVILGSKIHIRVSSSDILLSYLAFC